MIGVGLTVFAVILLLVIAVLLLPVAARIRLPHTVLLTFFGFTIGLILKWFEPQPVTLVGNVLGELELLGTGAEAIFYLLLPPMILNAALTISVRRLLDDIGPVLLLAIGGTLLSIAAIGLTLTGYSEYSIVACLMIGAIASTTDPLPIQEAFRSVGVPKRLDVLAEGESLLSDSTALVGYSLLLAVLVGSTELTFTSGVSFFLKASLGGALFGYVLARIFCLLYVFVGESHIARNTLSICLAYIAFFLVEVLLDWSGVMAVFAVALVLGSTGRAIYSPTNWQELLNLSGQLNFIAKSFVFVIVGMVAPTMIAGMGGDELKLLGLLFVAAFLARAISVYFMLPALSFLKLADPVDTPRKTVMFWGAARGAIPLALALAIIETPGIDSSVSNFIGTLVCGFVLMTLFINSVSMPLLLKLLGLKKLDKVDDAIRDKALRDALDELSHEVRLDRDKKRQSTKLIESAVEWFESRSRELASSTESKEELGEDEWLQIGLSIAAHHERQIYLRYLEERLVNLQGARTLLAGADDLIDGLRSNGEQGYTTASRHNLAFRWQTKFATWLHLRLRISYLLRIRLGRRFEKLTGIVPAMKEVVDDLDNRLGGLLSGDTMEKARSAVKERLDGASMELEGLELAYPEYGQALKENLHQLSIARLEQKKYEKLLYEAVINQEVYEDLVSAMEQRVAQYSRRPRLDLGLAPIELLSRVPLFAHLDEAQAAEILGLLKSRFAIPGEVIIRKGDVGDAMYFVSTGAVRIVIGGIEGDIMLGSGSCFGEMALVNNERRNADVVAEEYCKLLVIYRRDFNSMISRDPDFREEIRHTAQRRAEYNRDPEQTVDGG